MFRKLESYLLHSIFSLKLYFREIGMFLKNFYIKLKVDVKIKIYTQMPSVSIHSRSITLLNNYISVIILLLLYTFSYDKFNTYSHKTIVNVYS